MVKVCMVLLFAFLFWACEVDVQKELAYSAVVVEDIQGGSFECITEVLKEKDIVILGEAGHGDGKTFEVKANLIKYLIEKEGFNALAIEGAGFIDMQIKNSVIPVDSLLVFKYKKEWLPWWGYSKQTKLLIDFLKTHNTLKYIGLESYAHTELRDFLNKRLSEVEKNMQVLSKFDSVYSQLKGDNFKCTSMADLDFYQQQLDKIRNENDIVKTNGLLLQVVNNESVNIDNQKYSNIIGGFEAENIYVNIRDRQMANNLIWYKKRNPKAKIIVWIANFHGAKNIGQIRYKEDIPDLYASFTLFNDYLVQEYGDKVYSMAFTSFKGGFGELLFSDAPPGMINTPNNSLESELGKKNFDFAFIDFESVRKKKPNWRNKIFNSTLLGYDNKPGKWLDVFDGIFYIRENEPEVAF